MSVTAPVHREAVHRDGLFAFSSVRTVTRTEALAIAGLAAWTALLAVLTWGTWGDLRMDTGYDFVAASRVADGQLPYVDFTYWYGPLPAFALGGLYALTGAAVWPAVAFGLLVSVVAIALTYRLARTFVGAPAAALAAALVAPAAFSSANNAYVLPHSTSGPLAMVLVLGAILLLVRHPGRGRALVGAGTLAGLTALTRPELALAFYGAVAVWFAVAAWRTREVRAVAREALAFAAPAIALPALVYGAFALAVGLGPLLTENLYPQAFVDAAGHVVLEAHAPRTLASFAKVLGYTVLYAGGIAALVACSRAIAAGGRLRTAALAGAGLAAAGFLVVLAARPETVRYYLEFAYSWIPAGAALAVLALAWRARRADAPGDRGALLVVLVLAAAAAGTYASFKPFPNAAFPEATPYLLPLVGVFLAWLHTHVLGERAKLLGTLWLALLVAGSAGLALHDARAETGRVSGPNGTLGAAPEDVPALQGALDVIARETNPGDDILVAPQLSSLYVMSGRENPLAQISLLPGAFPTPADEQAAIRRLADVDLVLIDRTPLSVYEHGAFGTTFDRELAAWVHQHFERTASLSGSGTDALVIEAWRRRS